MKLRQSLMLALFGIVITASTAAAFSFEKLPPPETRVEGQWYKGQTHDHSFWSDGRTFPELVAKKYKETGFHFLVTTEHNCLAKGEKWKTIVDAQGKEYDTPAVEELREVFKNKKGWIVERTNNGVQQIRLKQFNEVAQWINEPGKFLMIQGCETTGKAFDRQIHVNGLNVSKAILPQPGKSTAEVISKDVAANVAVPAGPGEPGEPALATLNHPSWPHYDIEAETISDVKNLRFMEICHLGASWHRFGDDKHHDMTRKWDIANTIRIAVMKLPPIYGLAIDDAHKYYGENKEYNISWIMVRSEKLDVTSLFDAMLHGDYFASTGVTLKDVQYDPNKRTLTVKVDPERGVNYEIRFIGTMKDYDPKTTLVDDDKPLIRKITHYSDDVGRTFKTVKGARASYQLTGDELFVRAHILSDRELGRTDDEGAQLKAEAFTQPVGWEKHIE